MFWIGALHLCNKAAATHNFHDRWKAEVLQEHRGQFSGFCRPQRRAAPALSFEHSQVMRGAAVLTALVRAAIFPQNLYSCAQRV